MKSKKIQENLPENLSQVRQSKRLLGVPPEAFLRQQAVTLKTDESCFMVMGSILENETGFWGGNYYMTREFMFSNLEISTNLYEY